MSQRWTISINHTDGDSGGTFNPVDTEIPIIWDNLDAAKAALKRIAAIHNRLAFEKSSTWTESYDGPEPEGPLEKLPGYVDRSEAYNSIELLLDNGQPQRVGMFWEGYFSRLITAKIIAVEDPEMTFNPDEERINGYRPTPRQQPKRKGRRAREA